MGSELPIDRMREAEPPASPLVEATLSLVQDMVRAKRATHGEAWDGAISRADFEQVEQRILGTGYRFAWSASISAEERPEAYQPLDGEAGGDAGFSHPNAPHEAPDANGRALRGVGDNVVQRSADVSGTARFIRTNDRVLDYLTNGVPEGTIAVIDDSGGTLTAPIIEQFAGIICAGGTVRSHLGILSREYNIACLMNAKIAGIADGDRVTIEATAPAKTTEDYQSGVERVGRIWLEGAAA